MKKLCPDVAHVFTGFIREQEIMKEIANMAETVGCGKVKALRYRSWRNSRISRHHTRGINKVLLGGAECF